MFFLPLSDDNPTNNKPIISWLIIGLCIFVFGWQVSLGDAKHAAILALGVTPSALLGGAPLPPEIAAIPAWLTIFTSMFMHGGILHLAGNMLYLWIFGDNIEDSVGSKLHYILLYALCGIAAALAQAFADPTSPVPMIGASGAIAGLLGAYLILHPRANVKCLLVIIIFVRTINLPAWIVLGGWFALQFFSLGQTGSNVAYVAHIGGFVAGMALIPFFRRKTVPLFDKPHSRAFVIEPIAGGKHHIPTIVRRRPSQKTSSPHRQGKHPFE